MRIPLYCNAYFLLKKKMNKNLLADGGHLIISHSIIRSPSQRIGASFTI